MNKTRLIMVAAALVICGSLFGAVWRFHFGNIACAEITTSTVRIQNEDKDAFPEQYTQNGYAVVVCKLDAGRTLSIYDFSLADHLNTYPCIALRVGNGQFDAKNWKIEKTDAETLYSMLFRIDPPRGEAGRNVNMTLKYNYSTHRTAQLQLPFKLIGSAAPTDVSKITDGGMLPPRQ